MTKVRAASVLITMLLAGCAGEQFSLGGSTAAPPTPTVNMAGRWMLSAPNAPACGMNFRGADGAKEGTIAPEGGCLGNFFMSRHWTLNKGALTIADHEFKPLAELKLAGTGFEGPSTAGTLVTLAR